MNTFSQFARLLSLMLLFFGFTTTCQTDQAVFPGTPPDDLASFIEDGMEQWDIPGMAVAIVHRDSVVFAEGFGVRKLGESDPVDENTIFGVASISKAFTAAALGILVEEGRIHWDDPITDYLSDFQLYDSWVTQNVTIRDALTHRSGPGRIRRFRVKWFPYRDAISTMSVLQHRLIPASANLHIGPGCISVSRGCMAVSG